MSNFKIDKLTKEDVFEEFIFRTLGKFEDDGMSSNSVVADFMRENNFSSLEMSKVYDLVDKLCEASKKKGVAFSNRVCDELTAIKDMTDLAFDEIKSKSLYRGSRKKFLKDLKRQSKKTPHESAESLGSRLLGLN